MCTEYMHLGDLEHFLEKEENLSLQDLLKIALSAIKGMNYLANKDIVHRGIHPILVFM
jgi:serine/threonine protein kinase